MTASPSEGTRTGWTADDSTFGARLALIRQRMGWNIKEAARECGVPAATWALWERGGAEPRRMERVTGIAERTGCDLMWLAFGPQAGTVSTRHGYRQTDTRPAASAVRPTGQGPTRDARRLSGAGRRPAARAERAGTGPSLPRPAILPRRTLVKER